jgi:hypothetical protein
MRCERLRCEGADMAAAQINNEPSCFDRVR